MRERLGNNQRGQHVVGALCLALALSLISVSAPAQEVGTMGLGDWPADLESTAEEWSEITRTLPSLDTLHVDYQYAARDNATDLSFVLSWAPGETVWVDGEMRATRDFDRPIVLTDVELQAEVAVEGEAVAEMLIGVDDIRLEPRPSVYAFEAPDVDYADLFVDTSAESARALAEAGFTLRNPTLRYAVFTSEEAGAADLRPRPPVERTPDRGPRVRGGIGTTIRIGSGITITDRDRQPRGDTIGRTGDRETDARDEPERRDEDGAPPREERDGGERDDGDREQPRDGDRGEDEGSGDDDGSRAEGITDRLTGDDDDDDDASLVPAALIGVAAVGIAAFAGGTIGYSGTGRTPIGLSSGYTSPKGGFWLQGSVNRAVLNDGPNQRLAGRALVFYDFFDAPVQPALGLGAVARTNDGNGITVDESVSVGAVGNLGRVVLMGGWDFNQRALEFGIGINLRYSSDDR